MFIKKLYIHKRKWFLVLLGACTLSIFVIHFNLQARMEVEVHSARSLAVMHATKHPNLTKWYSWMAQSEPMDRMSEKLLECRTQPMGCFTLADKIRPADMKSKSFTDNTCLDTCFRRSGNYAGISKKKGLCYCSSSLRGFVSNKSMNAAQSADKADCSSATSVRVYMKKRNCEKGISDESLKLDRIGCMAVPWKLYQMMIPLKMPGMTERQCILNCQTRHFTFALPLLHVNSCICSDASSLFKRAENLHRISQACSVENGNSLPVFQTSIPDKYCGFKRFLPLKRDPATVLASFYGSGNTWLRHLIETATGFYTGSVYNDYILFKGGFIGESIPPTSGRVVVVKDHIFQNSKSLILNYKAAILLIRNPYDAIIAEYTRMVTNNHTGIMDPKELLSQRFKEFARNKAGYWLNMPKRVFDTIKTVMVVFYEDLVKNPVKQLRRIVQFIPTNAIHSSGDEYEHRLMCMVQDMSGHFKRESKKIDFTPFNIAARDSLDTAIREMDDLLGKNRQPPLPDYYFTL